MNTTKKDKKTIKVGSNQYNYSLKRDGKLLETKLWDSRQSKQVSVYANSESELKQKIKDKIQEINSQLIIATNRTVMQYFDYWMKTYKFNSIKRSTYDCYEKIINIHILPRIGNMKMKAVRTDDIQNLIADVSRYRAYSTVKKVNEALVSCFKHAYIMGDIAQNPMLMIKLPREKNLAVKTKQIEVYTDDEIKQLEDTINFEYEKRGFFRVAPIFVFMLNTGLRIGEALALRHDDVDLNAKLVYVNFTLSRIIKRNEKERLEGETKTEYILSDPKTDSSKRVVNLNSKAIWALKEMKRRNLEDNIPNSDFVFCSEIGNHFNPRSIEDTLKRVCFRANVPYYGNHSLRHSFVSRCFDKGIPIEIISDLVGHSSVSITRDVYLHILPRQKRQAVELLECI